MTILGLALVPGAVAGKGKGGGKGTGGTTTASGSLSLVMFDSNSNGVLNWGEAVTFKVSSTTSYPMVALKCYQNGVWVTNQTVGFYPGWPWSQTFPLSSWKWTGGAADCTATLYYSTSKGTVTLATNSFHAYA